MIIKFIWRETLLLLFAWGCIAFGMLCVFLSVMYPNDMPEPPIVTLGIIISGVVAFTLTKKMGITRAAFIEILKQNGFDVDNRKNVILGKNNNNILFSGYFYGRYIVLNDDLFRGPSSASNLNFYFPCQTKIEFDHYIIKSDNKVKIGRHIASVFMGSSTDQRAHTDLSNILSAIGTDVDFLIINHLQAGPGFIRIAMGPASLAYGEYAQKNTPAVLKFIQSFQTYYGCPDEKWDRQIDMNNLKENIDALNNEFVHSLREKYKNK